jgi:MoaA/NifB/PqqE/SkfB family radical SAM enzyme
VTDYTRLTQATQIPRIPLEGHFDLTYRCNNTCRHCWLWLAENAGERASELTR